MAAFRCTENHSFGDNAGAPENGICGGGVGGIAAEIALLLARQDPEVYEQAHS
jgi:hypothetical protein